MKVKNVIAAIVSIVLVGGAVTGGIYSYKSYQDKKLIAEVQPVSNLNWGYWGDTQTSYGMVTNDSSQEIYLESTKTVKNVFVEEGDAVSVGDKLLEYDTAELKIEIERKKLDLSTIENDIAIASHMLEIYNNAQPVDKTPPKLDLSKLEEYEKQDQERNAIPEKDVLDNRIYNYITEASLPYNMKTDPVTGEAVYPAGTEEEPYIYYCNKDAYVYGSFFNFIRATDFGQTGKYVKFIVCQKDANGQMVFGPNSGGGNTGNNAAGGTESTETAQALNSMTTESVEGTESTETKGTESTEIKGTESTETGGTDPQPLPDSAVSPNTVVLYGGNIPIDYDWGRMWYVFSGEEYIPVSNADKYMEEFFDKSGDWKEPEGYTKEEIYKGIIEKENELKTLDIRRRQQELQLKSLMETASDGIVYAKVDGVVKTVGDPDEFRQDGTAFLVVTGEEGLYVSGSISELLLNDVSVGTVVTANSWESGQIFEATITEISDYPVSSNSWGEGNPNVSYYAYTAYIEDSSSLKNGEYLDLSISTDQSESGGLYIDKAYVRQEDGRSYVMIADVNDRLKKQYVITGKTIYGSAIEIKSGLSEDDRIAFPYGKNAAEGVAVTDALNMHY